MTGTPKGGEQVIRSDFQIHGQGYFCILKPWGLQILSMSGWEACRCKRLIWAVRLLHQKWVFQGKKRSFCWCCSPQTDTQQCKLFSQSQSAAVLGSSGSKFALVHLYQVFFSSYYPQQILVLTWCFLGISFLFSSMYEFSIICLLNAIACNFPGWKKKEVPLKKM